MNSQVYNSFSTAELISRIARLSDQDALNHLISSRKLLWYSNKLFLLPDFLILLRENYYRPYIIIPSDERDLDEKIDLTYDRTLQKFLILKPQDEIKPIPGPYCNQQYHRMNQEILKLKEESPNLNELELESAVTRIFQKTVIRHLRYSWLETCRLTNRFYKRYRWRVKGGFIELKKPSWIDGRAFGKWLNENIPDPDHSRKNEKERVQTLVDQIFGFGSTARIDLNEERKVELSVSYDPVEKEAKEYVSINLYQIVAHEKAELVQKQRPAIRKLGKQKLNNLVLYILDNYLNDLKNDEDIAEEFGISKSTFSRFAGKDWRKNTGQNNEIIIPDLWKNMAGVIMQNQVFVETAINLGIKDFIDIIVNQELKVN